jgi:cobalt-zinc-cadmium efflux system outer membrane protein
MIRATVLLSVLALLAGCASTSPSGAWRDAAVDVEKRTGHGVSWDQGGDDDGKAREAVQNLLARELGVEDAVAVALLKNASLRATYEELGIAQADLVQAGLLKNPTFSAGMTTAERDAIDPNVVFGVTQDFLDLLMIPARKKVARSQLEQARLRVVDAVLDVAARTRAAYFTLAGALQVTAMRELVVEAGQASMALTVHQHEAGNASDLSLANERASLQELELALARSRLDAQAAREELAKLLGFETADGFAIPARLPPIPAREPNLDRVEAAAIAQRADLAIAHAQVETLAYATSLAKTSRFTGFVDIGADVARLRDGHVAVGPRISLELPIFDQRQGTIARLEALGRAASQTERALAIDIRADVRKTRARMLTLRALAERYATEIVPTRESVVKLAQQQFEAMLLGIFQLLQARQAEVSAYREYVETVRDYWIARSDLERAIGGRLPAASEKGK